MPAKLTRKNAIRNNRGASVILIVVALAIVQLTIDLFVVNVVQILMAQRQLSSVCEAAALAGTSMLARVDVANDDRDHRKLSLAQKAACRCAENMVLRSRILGSHLDRANVSSDACDLGKNLHAGACRFNIKLTDPEANFANVDFGDARGRTISCTMAYGFKPMLLTFLGDASYTIMGNCVGGLPQIDSVLVFDLSCAMDDLTPVTFVRREWIHSPLGGGHFAMGTVDQGATQGCGVVQYVSLQCPSPSHTLADYLGWDYEVEGGPVHGSLVNVLPPQNLDKADSDGHGAITRPLHFDAYLRSHYAHYDSKLRYQPWEAAKAPYYRSLDYCTPPGNCDLSVGLGGNGDAGSDLHGNRALPMNSVPQLNAFSDTTWQDDGPNHFSYQPAAPGALHGLAANDPIPSPDQETFTDLVANIAAPQTAKASGPNSGIPGQFIGFDYTFPSDESDPLLRSQTFRFPNIAVVVEAARGNLEATPSLPVGKTNAQMALIDRPVNVDGAMFDMHSIELKDGYQRAYQRLAMLRIQPLASVIAAADEDFLQKMHKLTDCRFGLVGYSSKGALSGKNSSHSLTFGTGDDQSIAPPDSRSFYVYAGPNGNRDYAPPTFDSGEPTHGGLNTVDIGNGNGQGFRIPRIPLDANNEHYTECVSKNKLANGDFNHRLNSGVGSDGIYNLRAESVSDSAEALETARNMFHSSAYDLKGSGKSRIPARRVIIFVTAGEPTNGVIGSEAQETLRIAGNGKGMASGGTCEADGIAVFAIGLNLLNGKAFQTLKAHQQYFLSDKPTNSTSGGIAWRAGHGGKYYPCESVDQLKLAFGDIARRFSQCRR